MSALIVLLAEGLFHGCAVQEQVFASTVDVFDGVLAVHGGDEFREVGPWTVPTVERAG